LREPEKTGKDARRDRWEAELDWYFGYAEGALRRGRLLMLPSHAAARTRACNAGRKARGLAQSVDRCLAVLAAPHGAVLRAVFTPRRWPREVESQFAHLAPLVVRLYGTCDPWPGRGSHQGLEEAVALRLAAHLSQGAARLEPLRLGAQRLLDAATTAYVAHRREVAPAAR
jgi:hypothetical protein